MIESTMPQQLLRRFTRLLKYLTLTRLIAPLLVAFILLSAGLYLTYSKTQDALKKESEKAASFLKSLETVENDLTVLKKTDQIKRNNELESTIKAIEKTYNETISAYEAMVDLPSNSKNLGNYRKQFAQVLNLLSDKNYSSGAAVLTTLKNDIEKEKAETSTPAFAGINVDTLTKSSTPPSAGYSRQAVEVNDTTYVIDLVAGDLASTRVIVDTASSSDCRDNCPTLPLATYVSRNGAYAGINGSYFCPAEYPTCAGKTNSFDTLAMGINKHYHNSDNNIYSTVPLVVFGNGFVRFLGATSGWGRDTGVDGVLANQPLLVAGGNVTFGGDGDPKKGSKGSRSFVANKGNTVYIGVVRNVTVAEAALVLRALGMENALNLDSGGSTALWSGGYKAGPGRNIPNVILFVRK